MATQLFIRTDEPSNWQCARDQHNINNENISQGGTARNFGFLGTTRGGGVVSRTLATVTGPTNPIAFGDGTPGLAIIYISDPIDQDVTISGTVTFNIWGLESGMNANAAFHVRVSRIDKTGARVSLVIASTRATEMGTSNAANNWTGTPTSTAFQKGDRICVMVGIDDAPTDMGSGFSCTFNLNGTTGAASGDSYVTFNETFGFLTTAPAGSQLFLTDTDSSVTISGGDFIEKEAWTSRGGTATNVRAKLTNGSGVLAYVNPTNQFMHSTTEGSETKIPGTGSNFETGANDWANPGNITANDGSVASVTSGTNGVFDELHGTNLGFTNVKGRIVGVASTIKASSNPTGQVLQTRSDAKFDLGANALTTSLAEYTIDFPHEASAGILASAARDSAFKIFVDDDGDIDAGVVYSVDYLQLKLYYAEIYEWYSKQLNSFTLSDLVRANLRIRQSAAGYNYSVGLEVAVVNSDGSSPTTYGWGFAKIVGSTTETAATIDLAGDDISVSNGQRLRFRIVLCPYKNPLFADEDAGNGRYLELYYNGPTGGASGDTYVTLTQSVSEFIAGLPEESKYYLQAVQQSNIW